MIKVQELIADFRMMWQERWAYGSETRRGQVDCSGAFVWAYAQHGCQIYHGSNRIAREEVVELIPIAQARVEPGMAAFKARKRGMFTGWALPAGYQAGGAHYNGDLLDYYHVGLVDADTSRVLNAQNAAAGFVASPIGNGWTHVGRLRQVDYGEGKAEGDVGSAKVWAERGSTVNLRAGRSTSARLVDRVPLGATVTLLGAPEGDWYEVQWGKKKGYMKSEFLIKQ